MKTTEVYILHFEPAYKHARHYVGSTSRGNARGDDHLAGRGSPLVSAAIRAGVAVTFHVIGVGGRIAERKIKQQKNAGRFCPQCQKEKNKNDKFNRTKSRDERQSQSTNE